MNSHARLLRDVLTAVAAVFVVAKSAQAADDAEPPVLVITTDFKAVEQDNDAGYESHTVQVYHVSGGGPPGCGPLYANCPANQLGPLIAKTMRLVSVDGETAVRKLDSEEGVEASTFSADLSLDGDAPGTAQFVRTAEGGKIVASVYTSVNQWGEWAPQVVESCNAQQNPLDIVFDLTPEDLKTPDRITKRFDGEASNSTDEGGTCAMTVHARLTAPSSGSNSRFAALFAQLTDRSGSRSRRPQNFAQRGGENSDYTSLLAAAFVALIGAGIIRYGWKTNLLIPKFCGIILILFPYFLSSTLLIFVIAAVIVWIAWMAMRFGW